MVFPAMLILLPQYLMIQWFYKLIPAYADVGVVRTVMQLFSIVLINIKGTALSVMIFTAAISSIPQEIEDSAMIDGASSWQYIRYILLPLLKVPIVSLMVIMFPLIYNQFLEPYVYLDPKNSTLLPLQGIGEDNFFLNEYLSTDVTLLDFNTVGAYGDAPFPVCTIGAGGNLCSPHRSNGSLNREEPNESFFNRFSVERDFACDNSALNSITSAPHHGTQKNDPNPE